MSRNPPKRIISDLNYLYDRIDELPDEKITSNIVETAERLRIFPKGSPFPGKQRYSRTPYMIDPAMELSPQSDTEEVIICKCGQGGATAGATEPLILFKIDQDPGPVLAITANDELAKTWNDDRLDPMLESSGVIKKLTSSITKNSQHGGKGNSALKKTWPGGRLDIKTYGKVSQIRQISYQTVILEEEEEAANAVQRGSKQGRFRDIAFARTRAFRGRRKILRISTPLLRTTSEIWPAFLSGDQNYYYVPCPCCGHMQRLIWKHLKYETNEHNIVDIESVYYECQGPDCDYHIKNEEKTKMLVPESLGGRAKWIPHNKEKARPKTKSYQFSALYVPPGMDTWADLAQQWVDAQGDPEKLQVFINLNLGEPFEDYSESPPAETCHILKGTYRRDHLPNAIEGTPLFTMIGADVQQGNMRDGKYLPGKEQRIEASLIGFGLNGRTWTIEHYKIPGAVTDYRSGAWAKFKKMIINEEFPMMPQKIFVDARHQTDQVKRFCNGGNNIFPIMGEARIKEKYFRKIDLPEFRSGNGSPLALYELNTNPIKRRIYNHLLLRQDPLTHEYPYGYMMFPVDIESRYFEQLTAERPIPIIKNGKKVGTQWDAGGRSNEALDCYCYAWMALEVFMNEVSTAAGETATNEREFWNWAAKKFLIAA